MLRAGLIGLPSTGKTTLFRLLTGGAAGHPSGCSNSGHADVGIAQVPDERLDRLATLLQPRRAVPATVAFADLTARAGATGLFDVTPYREADALLHVVRAFRDERVPHPHGSIDPARDTRTIDDELILTDLAVAERRLERIERDMRKGVAKNLDSAFRVLGTCREALADATPLRALELEPAATKLLRGFQFLSAKPLLLVINVDEADAGAQTAEAVDRAPLADILTGVATRAVSVCAKLELEISELNTEDAASFRTDLDLQETGLDRVIRAAYELLGYISFFTASNQECRAWSVPAGTVAHVAAREIHTDMARGFIRAEMVDYNHLISRGSLLACRHHGEVRLEGKNYVVRDGDVINFRFAT